MSPEIFFDDSALGFVLEAFGNTVDDEGYIIKEDTGERVRTREGNPVRPEDLGGIAEGSEIYVEDNYVSVLEYVKDKHRRE
jgi:hypothetical protein